MDIAGVGLGKTPTKSTIIQTQTAVLPLAPPAIESDGTVSFSQFFPQINTPDDGPPAPATTRHVTVETGPISDAEMDPEILADSVLPDVPNLTGRDPIPADDGTVMPQALDDVYASHNGFIQNTIETTVVEIPQQAAPPLGTVQPIPARSIATVSDASPQRNLNTSIPVQPQQLPAHIHGPTVTAVVEQQVMVQTPNRVTPKVAVNIFARATNTQAAPVPPGAVPENIFRNATTPVAADDAPQLRDTAMPRITKRQSNLSHPQQKSVPTGPISGPTTAPPVLNQAQVTDTALRDAVNVLANDSADLVQTILRDFGTPQNAGATQPRLPVMTQIAQTLPQQPPQTHETYDVDLSPKDLGKVRISLTPQDSGIMVTILCDVDSTAQLARQHIDHLARDLMQMGYASVDIDVAGQNANNADSSPPQTGAQHTSTKDGPNMAAPVVRGQYGPHPSHKSDGIDVMV